MSSESIKEIKAFLQGNGRRPSVSDLGILDGVSALKTDKEVFNYLETLAEDQNDILYTFYSTVFAFENIEDHKHYSSVEEAEEKLLEELWKAEEHELALDFASEFFYYIDGDLKEDTLNFYLEKSEDSASYKLRKVKTSPITSEDSVRRARALLKDEIDNIGWKARKDLEALEEEFLRYSDYDLTELSEKVDEVYMEELLSKMMEAGVDFLNRQGMEVTEFEEVSFDPDYEKARPFSIIECNPNEDEIIYMGASSSNPHHVGEVAKGPAMGSIVHELVHKWLENLSNSEVLMEEQISEAFSHGFDMYYIGTISDPEAREKRLNVADSIFYDKSCKNALKSFFDIWDQFEGSEKEKANNVIAEMVIAMEEDENFLDENIAESKQNANLRKYISWIEDKV